MPPDERVETDDGLELTLATNVVVLFLLSRLLRGKFEKAPDGRVIRISSGGMYTRRLNLEDPKWTERHQEGMMTCAETMRSHVVLSELWSEAQRGSSVTVNVMYPGWADTPSVKKSLQRFRRITRDILWTAAEGTASVAQIWSGALVNQLIRMHFRRIARDEAPRRARRAKRLAPRGVAASRRLGREAAVEGAQTRMTAAESNPWK